MFKYINHEIIFKTNSKDGEVTVSKSTWSGSKGEEIHYIVTLYTGKTSTTKTATFKNLETAMKRAKKYTDIVMSQYTF